MRAALLLAAFAISANARQNIVFFLVDDLGWANIAVNGSSFHETPHIDGLAASGMRFTNGYAAASICSPTRAALMTGRSPVRVKVTDWLPGAKEPKGSRFKHVEDANELALSEVTIAEVLRDAGYQTFFAGKWHLGGEGFLPTDQGFDVNIGGQHHGGPPGGYYSPWKNPHLKAKKDGEYLTERLTEESISFMEKRDTERPFLLYLSYYNVHTPIQPYKKRHAHYVAKAATQFTSPAEPIAEHGGVSRPRQDNPDFASMVAAVDDSVGAILAALDRLNLSGDTTVFFTSDNGGLCTKVKPGPTSNLPLRSGKGWLYEGGIRVPWIIRAPGITKAGSTSAAPIISMDAFPTILELAHLSAKPALHADGQSILPLLRGDAPGKRSLQWHYPHYHGSTWAPGAAIREGDWKLISFYETDEIELYNIKDDIGEHKNLSASHPEIVQRLQKQLIAWQKQQNAVMPEPRD
ncbi:MAG: arylsulfatase A-like enzyme [Rhodothermales bacterium]|jgi:arylsulfatase A-like enzyme